MLHDDIRSFVKAVRQSQRETNARGGDLVPADHLEQLMECATERGVHFVFKHVDGEQHAIVTVMDEDGLPIEAHGGPARIKRNM